jgi:ribose transport system substrate-binding protein
MIDRCQSKGPRLRWLAVLLATGLVFAGAGCGGDEDESASGGNAEAPAEASGASSAVEEAKQRIDEARAPLVFEPPGPAIDVAELQGKRVRIINIDQRIPILAQTAEAARDAGREVGLEVEIFDAQSNPTKMVQGVEQGRQNADAMLLISIPTQLVAESVQKADADGIPVVSVLDTQPVPDEPGQGAGAGFFGNVSTDIVNGGELVASATVAAGDGEAQVAIFSTNEADPSPFVVEGMKNVFDECEGCEIVEEVDTPPAEWATSLAQRAQAVIREHPDLDYILPVFDGMAIFTIPAVEQAGTGGRVKVATFNATPAALEFMLNGDTLIADPGQSNTWSGWASIDQAMRGMLGVEPADPVIPVRFFDKTNLDGVDVNDEAALFGNPDYQNGYRELWGLR